MPIQRVMDAGHSVFEFDASDAKQVTEAEKRFRELTAQGFWAVERNPQRVVPQFNPVRQFNPNTEETLFLLPLHGPAYEQPPSTIAQRIVIARLKESLSQSGLAEKLGVSRGAVGQWETGATEPSDANLRRLALETKVPFEWLATGRGVADFYPATPRAGTAIYLASELAHAVEAGGLKLAGAVEAGVFRAPEFETQKLKRAPVCPDFRYARASQHAWEVRGDGMNLAGIEDGSYVVATPLEEFKKKYGPLEDGSLVVVQRWRCGTESAERELSILEYHLAIADHIELRPRSTNKAHKPLFIPPPASELALFGEPDTKDKIQIIGVVLSVVRLLNP
jgi:transcriptional regulator with XRE-family HTH domain